MLKVYIAGPYTAINQFDQRRNIDNAIEHGKEVALAGFVPCVPHANTAFWERDSRFAHWTHTDWMQRICLPQMLSCDIVFFTGDWQQSVGCLIEHEEAERLGLRRVYSIEELKKAVAA